MDTYFPLFDTTIVGDVTAPLLHVVPEDHPLVTASSILAEFKPAQYVPLRRPGVTLLAYLFIMKPVKE